MPPTPPRAGSTLPPAGQRPIHIDRGPRTVRLLALCIVVLAFAQRWMVHSATALPRRLDFLTLAPLLDDTQRLLGVLAGLLTYPAFVRLVQIGALVVLGIYLLELLCALAWRIGWSVVQRQHSTETVLYRVRAPRATGRSGARPASSADSDLQRSLNRSLHPRGTGWVAFLLSAVPNEPALLGYAVVVRRRAERQRVTDDLRHAIVGQMPDIAIDPAPDRLHAALTAGRVVLWREFNLAAPPHYPLRTLDDITHADLLGQVLTALQVRAPVAHVEFQLVSQPDQTPLALSTGWRARGRDLWLALEHRNFHATSAESTAVETKIAAPTFQVTLRVVVVVEAAAVAAGQAALAGVATALGSYQARTAGRTQAFRMVRSGAIRLRERSLESDVRRVRRLIARAPSVPPAPRLLLPFRIGRPAAILSTHELGGLWHLPIPSLGPLLTWLHARRLPVPDAAIIRPTGVDRITFGHAQLSDGSEVPVGPDLLGLRQICHITAGMGAGKTRLLANICQQLLPHGFTLIDGKGDDVGNLTATVLRLIPPDQHHRVVVLNVLDLWPIALNPLANVDHTSRTGVDLAVGQLMAVFARLDPESWGGSVRMKQNLDMATRLVLAGEPTPTIAHVKQALLDPDYRARLLPRCRNVEVVSYWTEGKHSEVEKTSREALLSRFNQLLTSEVTRSLLVQTESRFSFREAIAQRQIVLVPIPHIALGGLAEAVAMLIFQSFIRAAFERPGDALSRTHYPLVVDEFQVLVENAGVADIKHALSQLRSFGVPTIYAHQTLDQLGDSRNLMLTNAENRVILKTREPDASAYAALYPNSGLTPGDIAGQEPTEHQYAVFAVGGQSHGPFSMRPLPWPTPLALPAPIAWPATDWSRMLPPTNPDTELDLSLHSMIYAPAKPEELEEIARMLAAADERAWTRICVRWEAIAATQRAYLLQTPTAIRDQVERMTWLSRLSAGLPPVLAAAAYLRIRRAVTPDATDTPAPGERFVRSEGRVVNLTISSGAPLRGVTGAADGPSLVGLPTEDTTRQTDRAERRTIEEILRQKPREEAA